MIPIFLCFDNKIAKFTEHVFNSIKQNTKSKIKDHALNFSAGAIYERFNLPDYFPDYDKILYFDNDVIINADIEEFYNCDFNDNLCVAVRDTFSDSIFITIKYQRGIKIVDDYDLNYPSFLSGQLLINAKLWRREKIADKIKEFVKKYNCLDMVAFNVICKDRIKEIHCQWSAPAAYIGENGFLNNLINDKVNFVDFSNANLYHCHGSRKWWNTKGLYAEDLYIKYGGQFDNNSNSNIPRF